MDYGVERMILKSCRLFGKDHAPAKFAHRKPSKGVPIMPDNVAIARQEVSIANRILANEGLLDAFGHVSMRHPAIPERFLISRHRAPDLVAPADIVELGLDGEPAVPTAFR